MESVRRPQPGPVDALAECDQRLFNAWEDRTSELVSLAPIVASRAFSRLGGITFLGALSPRFRSGNVQRALDGSRRSHSLGVALLNLGVARKLGFAEATQRYAAACGLLHDIGNWPLSHSGEWAFCRLTGRTTRELRRELIVGADTIPASLRLRDVVLSSGLDVDVLVAMLEHRHRDLAGELRELSCFLASPLVPDTFEGMWRCGGVLGIEVPKPDAVVGYWVRDGHQIRVRRGSELSLIEFWRSKAQIYESFFNRPDIVCEESAWGQAILSQFAGLSPAASLALSEDDVVERVMACGLPTNVTFSRYKAPCGYRVNLSSGEQMPLDATLEQVAKIFVSEMA